MIEKISWVEMMPNTYARMKKSFFERCENDQEFREQMIKEGVLEIKEKSSIKDDECDECMERMTYDTNREMWCCTNEKCNYFDTPLQTSDANYTEDEVKEQ